MHHFTMIDIYTGPLSSLKCSFGGYCKYWPLNSMIENVFKTEVLFSSTSVVSLMIHFQQKHKRGHLRKKKYVKWPISEYAAIHFASIFCDQGKFTGLLGLGLWPFYSAPGSDFDPAKHPNSPPNWQFCSDFAEYFPKHLRRS